MFQINLPWPPRVLSPNSRKHWAAKMSARRKYRADCHILARTIRPKFPDGKIFLKITFSPPDNRRRDDDNMIASFKAARDGIAEAWGVDDHRFKCEYVFEAPVKHGRITVEWKACNQVF